MSGQKGMSRERRVCGLVLLAGSLLLGQASCSLLARTSPGALPDYDNSDGFILDYAVGDRFETVKTMLLTRPVGRELSLDEPGMGVPSIEQYEKDPTRFRYVVRLVPAGTALKLVAIKDAGYHTSVTYVQLAGTEEWVGVTLKELTKVGVDYRLRYNREFFRRL